MCRFILQTVKRGNGFSISLKTILRFCLCPLSQYKIMLHAVLLENFLLDFKTVFNLSYIYYTKLNMYFIICSSLAI